MAAPFTTYKLIVLYILSRTTRALSNSQLSEFILEHEYTNYFNFQQAVSELVEANLIRKHTMINTSYYQLTDAGRDTLSFFEKELSPEIRREVLEYLKLNSVALEESVLTPADYFQNPQGHHMVRCQIMEGSTSLLDITLAAPGEEAAKAICLNWPKKAQTIYERIMEELL